MPFFLYSHLLMLVWLNCSSNWTISFSLDFILLSTVRFSCSKLYCIFNIKDTRNRFNNLRHLTCQTTNKLKILFFPSKFISCTFVVHVDIEKDINVLVFTLTSFCITMGLHLLMGSTKVTQVQQRSYLL